MARLPGTSACVLVVPPLSAKFVSRIVSIGITPEPPRPTILPLTPSISPPSVPMPAEPIRLLDIPAGLVSPSRSDTPLESKLLATIVLCMPAELAIPPANTSARLPVIVEFRIMTPRPSACNPPPDTAELLPLTVVLLILESPEAWNSPPPLRAEFPTKVLRCTLRVPTE